MANVAPLPRPRTLPALPATLNATIDSVGSRLSTAAGLSATVEKKSAFGATQRTDAEELIHTIRALPDIAPRADEDRSGVQPSGSQPSVTERIALSRRERHDTAMEELLVDLVNIRNEMEPRVADALVAAKGQLRDDALAIDAQMAPLLSDEQLIDLSHVQVQAIREALEQRRDRRSLIIGVLMEELVNIEAQRVARVSAVLQDYEKILKSIAFLLPDDVERVLFAKAQEVNVALVENRIALIDFRARLLSQETDEDHRRLELWLRRTTAWRAAKLAALTEGFLLYLDENTAYEATQRSAVEAMFKELSTAHTRRAAIVRDIAALIPPKCDPARLAALDMQLQTATTRLREIAGHHCDGLARTAASYHDARSDKLQAFQRNLVEENICAANDVAAVLAAECVPRLQAVSSEHNNIIDALRTWAHAKLAAASTASNDVFLLVQAAGSCWTRHCAALEASEQGLTDQLATCRAEHDARRQDLENDVSTRVDQLRQAASLPTLTGLQTQIKEKLEAIAEVYASQADTAIKLVKSYPTFAATLVKEYDEGLVAMLGLQRSTGAPAVRFPKSGRKTTIMTTLDKEAELVTTSGAHFTVAQKATKPSSRAKSRAESVPMPVAVTDASPPPEPATHPAWRDTAMLFLTSFTFSFDTIPNTLRALRLAWLEHSETYSKTSPGVLATVVHDRELGLRSELDAELRLHRLRGPRIEEDVANVRAAELALHRDRIARHARGLTAALEENETQFRFVKEELANTAAEFNQRVKQLQNQFASTSTVHQPRIAAEAAAARDTFQKNLRNTLRGYRAGLDQALHGLRDSNASMRASLRAFSEGGNFCADEIDEYRAILQSLSARIDAIEGSITADLDTLETSHTSHSDEALSGLQVTQAQASKDAAFVEDSQRRARGAAVRIRAELAASDAKTAELAGLVAGLGGAIEPWDGPAVLAALPRVTAALATRIAFLDASRAAAAALLAAMAAPGTAVPGLAGPVPSNTSSHSAAPGSAAVTIVGAVDSGSGVDRDETATPRLRTGGGGLRPEDAFAERGRTKSDGRKTGARTKTSQVTLSHGYRVTLEALVGGSVGSLLATVNDVRAKCRMDMLEAAAAFYHDLQRTPRTLTRLDIRDTIQSHAEHVATIMADLLKPVMDHRAAAICGLLTLCATLETALAGIPAAAFAAVASTHWAVAQRETQTLLSGHRDTLAAAEQEWHAIMTSLRPALGHPQNKPALDAVCAREEKRQVCVATAWQSIAASLVGLEKKVAAAGMAELSSLCVQLCATVEPCFVTDELVTPTLEPPKKPLLELLSEQARPVSSSNVRSRAVLTALSLPGPSPLIASGLVPAPTPPSATSTPKPARARTTLPPTAPLPEPILFRDGPLERSLIAARDAAWQSLTTRLAGAAEEQVAMIQDGKAVAEHRATEWKAAVAALTSLYS